MISAIDGGRPVAPQVVEVLPPTPLLRGPLNHPDLLETDGNRLLLWIPLSD